MNKKAELLPIIFVALGLGLWMASVKSLLPLVTLAAIFIHEIGHLTAARALDIKVSGFHILSFEARLAAQSNLIPYGKEMAICAAGPFFNLATFLGVLLLKSHGISTPALSFLANVSASLALLNLLPIGDLDGGRIFLCFFSLTLPPAVASLLCRILSFLALFSLWCISVYSILRLGGSISLFVFSATLFFRIFATETPT